jgi:PilZ domain
MGYDKKKHFRCLNPRLGGTMIFRERQFERYTYKAPVLFKYDKFSMWQFGNILDLSLGGLLIKSDLLPNMEVIMEIKLANLIDGNFISLKGKVVRNVPAPRGPAIGIEFIIPKSSSELVRLCTILKNNQQPETKGRVTSSHVKKDILEYTRQLLDKAQFMDFYQTIDMKNSASMEELTIKRKEIMEKLAVSPEGFTDAETKLFDEGLRLVKRLTGILTNPVRRLGYDMAVGSVSPAVVKECYETYNVDIKPFKEYWEKKYSAKIEKATMMVNKAKATNDDGIINSVIKEAAILAPFHYILK